MGDDVAPIREGFYSVSEETREKIMKVVAGNSKDADECEMFLEELGIK